MLQCQLIQKHKYKEYKERPAPNRATWCRCAVEVQGLDDEVFKEVIGHETTFDLEQVNGKTRIRFSQSGFSEKNDLYAGINYSWGKYLESLRQYIQTGISEGFGTEKYRS